MSARPIPDKSLADRLPPGVRFIERDWLSSNNVLMFDAAGATLVDSGFIKHAPMTEALVRHELAARDHPPLLRIINTHLHSDHCGGNARLVQAFGCRVCVPAGNFESVLNWDDAQMHHGESGQRVDRFAAHEHACGGDEMELGAVPWIFLGAPGHDEHSLMLYCPTEQILISADALWENGFGLNFAAFTGSTQGFDEQQAVLDVIAQLPVRLVIPGHGPLFADIEGALTRAYNRLAAQRSDLVRHARYGVKVLLKFQLLDEERAQHDEFVERMARTLHTRQCADLIGIEPARACSDAIEELLTQGAIAREGDTLINR